MSSLLVTIFVLEVVVHLINVVGSSVINNLLWTLLNFLPLPTAKAATEQRKIQSEYLKVRRDLNATSSQDEFAKWAKLRRQHDKLLDQLEKSKKSQEATRASFDKFLNVARLVLTRAPQYFLPFWYSTEPMFWLPHGWFPYYAEWILSFPKAPLGSVSIASWQLACTGVITLVSDLIGAVFRLATESKQKKKEVLVKAKADKDEKKGGTEKAQDKAPASAAEEKKEL